MAIRPPSIDSNQDPAIPSVAPESTIASQQASLNTDGTLAAVSNIPVTGNTFIANTTITVTGNTTTVDAGENVVIVTTDRNVYVTVNEENFDQNFITNEVNNVGGDTGQIQFNLAGNFTGDSTLLFNNTTKVVSAEGISTDNLLYANGDPWNFSNIQSLPGGANGEVQFNDDGVFNGVPGVTWANAKFNLGVLSNLSIAGGSNGQVLSTDGAGNLSWSSTAQTYSNANVANYLPTFTGNLSANWILADYVSGNANPLFAIPGANVVGTVPSATNASFATTSTTANVALSVAGANVTGTVANATNASFATNSTTSNTANSVAGANVTGTVANANFASYSNVAELANSVIVESVNNNYSYHVVLTTGPGDTTLHNDVDDSFQYNPAEGTLTVTRVDASYFVGNLAFAQGLPASNVTGLGNVATINLDGNVSNVLYGNGAFAAAPGGNGGSYSNSNVASYLPTYTGNVGAGNVLATNLVRGTDVTALSMLSTANLSSNGLATIARINVTNTANLGAVGNVTITGGSAGQVLSTNGSGGLSWVNQSNGGGGSYGDSNVANLLANFGSNSISTTGNITAGNIIGNVANANFAEYSNTADLSNRVKVESVNNNYSYHVVLTTGPGDTTLHNDSDDNFQYNPADGILTVTRADVDYLQVSQSVLSNLVPFDSLPLNLGNNTNPWQNIHAGNATLTGTGTALNVSSGNILTNHVTGTAFNFLNGLYTASLTGQGATSNYTLNLPSSAGSNGQVLSTDGTGNLSWITAGGGNATLPLANGNSNFDIATANGNVTITANGSSTWTFGDDGNMTAPGAINVGNMSIGQLPGYITADNNTGIIVNVTGSDGGFVVDYLKEVGNANTTGGELAFSSELGNATYRISLSDDFGDGFATKIWRFDGTGNLSLPGGGSLYSLPSTPSGAPGNTIVLQPAGPSFITDQKLMVYPTAGDGDHIHMTTGNLYQTELFLGSDNFFVKLSNTGNVVINPNDNISYSATWTFSPDGNLTLANGNSVIYSTPNSSLDPTNPNVSTMTLTPDANYNSQVLVLDPTAPGHIHLRAHSFGNIDDPAANIFLGGEATSFEITYGSNNQALIHSNNYTWTFGNDGTLLLPRDAAGNTDPYLWITGGPAPSISSVDVSLGGPANFQIVSDYLNLSGYSGAKVAIKADNGEIATDANMVLTTNAANVGNAFSWTFGTDGNLTLPDNTSSINYANGTPYGGSAGVAEASFSIQSANFSAVAGSRYGVDTTSSAVTATLPASPATGVAIFFADAGGAYATNNLTINAGAGTIMGGGNTLTVSTNNQSVGLFYNGSTWRIYNAG